jgi:hypothetical protein
MNQIENYNDLNAVAGDLIEGVEIEGLEKLSDTNLEDLEGIIDDMEGLGDLGRSKKKRARKRIRRAQVNKATKRTSSSTTQIPSAMNYTKSVYASQMKQLPADIQKGFASKDVQLVDYRYYSTKIVEGATYVRMFDLGDNDTVEGISNTPNGKVPAGEYFSCRGIRLVAGEATTPDLAGAKAADYSSVAPAIVMNGEMTFGIGNVNFFEKMPISVTDTRQNTTGKVGEYYFDCPKMLKANEKITFNLFFAGAAAAATSGKKLALRLELIGSKNAKN